MKKRIRIQGILIAVAIASTFIFSKIIFEHWQQPVFDDFFDVLGTLFVFTGFYLRTVARGHKEEKSANGIKLVKDGPYSIIRNPMYFGTLLIGLGICLVLFALWVVPIFLIVYLFIYVPQIKKEEILLVERFGEEFKAYGRNVPAFFPKLNDFENLKSLTVVKSIWIKKELSSFVGMMSFVAFYEAWEDLNSFGAIQFYTELLTLGLILLVYVAYFILNSIRK